MSENGWKLYSPESTCEKCGCNKVKVIYHKACCTINSYSICYYIKHEHMLRICERCHYEWLELPLQEQSK